MSTAASLLSGHDLIHMGANAKGFDKHHAVHPITHDSSLHVGDRLAPSASLLSTDSPLMSVGVNSIAAIKIAARLRRDVGVDLSAMLVFEYPTPAAIAAHLETLGLTGPLIMPSAIVAVVEDELTSAVVPTSSAYADFGLTKSSSDLEDEWLHIRQEIAPTGTELLPASPPMIRDCQVKNLNMAMFFELKPDDDVQLVTRSFEQLATTHPMMRSVHKAPLFSINERLCLMFDVYDHSMSLSDLIYNTVHPIHALSTLPIDISRAVMRARLFNVTSLLKQYRLLGLSIHHAILDGPSQQIVYSHLTKILESRRAQDFKSVLTPAYDASLIARHTIAHYMHMSSVSLEQELAYEVFNLHLPFERPAGERVATRYVSSTRHVHDVIMFRAQESATRMCITLNALLLGSLAWLLHQCLSQRHVAIWQTYLGRSANEMQLVGSYSISTLMVFPEDLNLEATCRHVQAETQRLLALDGIMQSTQVPTVAYELNDLRPMEQPSEAYRQPQAVLLLDLFFFVNQYTDGYSVVVAYDENKHDHLGVDALVKHWIDLWIGWEEPAILSSLPW